MIGSIAKEIDVPVRGRVVLDGDAADDQRLVADPFGECAAGVALRGHAAVRLEIVQELHAAVDVLRSGSVGGGINAVRGLDVVVDHRLVRRRRWS